MSEKCRVTEQRRPIFKMRPFTDSDSSQLACVQSSPLFDSLSNPPNSMVNTPPQLRRRLFSPSSQKRRRCAKSDRKEKALVSFLWVNKHVALVWWCYITTHDSAQSPYVRRSLLAVLHSFIKPGSLSSSSSACDHFIYELLTQCQKCSRNAFSCRAQTWKNDE